MNRSLATFAVSLLVTTAAASPGVAHVGSAIVFDDRGRLYFCDTARDIVWRVEADGRLTAIARGVHTNVLFVRPDGSIDYPEGGYLPDTAFTGAVPGPAYRIDRNRILMRRRDGSVVVLAGSEEPGFLDAAGEQARFRRPVAFSVDGSGNLYVADYGNHRVRKVTPEGEVTTIARSRGLWFPTGIAFDDGAVYVLERFGNYWGPTGVMGRLPLVDGVAGNPRVRIIPADGSVRTYASLASFPARVTVVVLVTLVLLGVGWVVARLHTRRRPTQAKPSSGIKSHKMM